MFFAIFLATLAENRDFPENHQNSNLLKKRSKTQKIIPGTVLESLRDSFPKKLGPNPKKSFLMHFCNQNGMVYLHPGIPVEY